MKRQREEEDENSEVRRNQEVYKLVIWILSAGNDVNCTDKARNMSGMKAGLPHVCPLTPNPDL